MSLNIPAELQGSYIATSKGVEKYETMAARNYCRSHVLQHYTETQQLNVLMSGDQVEIEKMRTFIQACRDWSHQDSPVLSDLVNIKP